MNFEDQIRFTFDKKERVMKHDMTDHGAGSHTIKT